MRYPVPSAVAVLATILPCGVAASQRYAITTVDVKLCIPLPRSSRLCSSRLFCPSRSTRHTDSVQTTPHSDTQTRAGTGIKRTVQFPSVPIPPMAPQSRPSALHAALRDSRSLALPSAHLPCRLGCVWSLLRWDCDLGQGKPGHESCCSRNVPSTDSSRKWVRVR